MWQQQSGDSVVRHGGRGLGTLGTPARVPAARAWAGQERGSTRGAGRRSGNAGRGRLTARGWSTVLGWGVLVGLGLGTVRAPQVHATWGGWTVTGSLHEERSYHTATLLHNGTVLVAGGFNNKTFRANTSAELYDPGTGSWTPTESMQQPRAWHTATLLRNGHVLVAGGLRAGNTVEVYKPETGTWYAADAMWESRTRHTATLLANGKVLITGGAGVPSPTVTGEVYDPVAMHWHMTGSLSGARSGHQAARLWDGKVLVVGGLLAGASQDAEVYDPLTNAWTPTSDPVYNRFENTATATGLGDGRVLLTGGVAGVGSQWQTLDAVEVYTPAWGHWSAVANLQTARSEHAAVLLRHDQVLVMGGRETTAYNGPRLRSAEVFDPATLRWTPIGDLNFARAGHTATVLANGKTLVVGGHKADNSPSTVAEGTGLTSIASAELLQAPPCWGSTMISPLALSPGNVDTPYWESFHLEKSSDTVTWSLSAGHLPTGLTLEAEQGTLAGTPMVPGTFLFSVGAFHLQVCLGEMTYALVIEE